MASYSIACFAVTRRAVVLLAAIAMVLAVLSCQSAKREYGITLDSGVNRKTAYVGDALAEAQGRAPAASAAGSVSEGLERAAGSSSASQLRFELNLLKARNLRKMPDVSAIFLPEAYAAEHPIGDKYIIRTGTLDIQATAVKDAISTITQTALKYGGGVTDSNICKDAEGYRNGYITLRVPSEHFFEAWNELVAIDDVTGQQIRSEDRGEEYVSAVGQMNSLLAEQAALQKMYEEALHIHRTRGLRDGYSTLLETQRRLGEVNSQIRAMESALTSLADRIAFSTITVNLSEKPRDAAMALDSGGPFNWGIGATLDQAARESKGTLRSLLQSLLYFTVSLRWVPWLLAFLLGRWAWKRWITASQTTAQRA